MPEMKLFLLFLKHHNLFPLNVLSILNPLFADFVLLLNNFLKLYFTTFPDHIYSCL